MTNQPHKSWRLTLNNPVQSDLRTFGSWATDVTRMVISREVGEQGTPHLQGAIWFKRCYRLTQLRKLHTRTHWEPMLASKDALYEKKEGSEIVVEVDNRNQGKRSDLDETIDAIKNGSSIQELWVNHTSSMIRFKNGIISAHHALAPRTTKSDFVNWRWEPLTDFSKSIIIQGASGIGKTEYAKMHFQNSLMVSHMDDLLEFVTEVHDGIVFDDMKFRHLPRTAQIHLLDTDNDRSIHCRYNTAFIPKGTRKIFTCNDYDGDIFDLNDPAIMRRVNVVTVTEVS